MNSELRDLVCISDRDHVDGAPLRSKMEIVVGNTLG